ncbi:MAG: amidohydrolase family protein, partial [Chloroflexota bacterium]
MAASPVIDRILINGRITTLDRAQPQVTALAISRDRIVAAGTDDSIRALAVPGTAVDNLEGRIVIPGLTDAHIHWEGVAHSLREIDVFEVPTKQEALRRVAERVRTAAPGEWLVGRGWTQDFWPDRAFPTAADLDAIAPNNPVYLMAKSWHAAWVNSAALRIAGITANTPDPAGGSFVRDASGQPTGLLLEAPAMTLVWNHIVPPTPDQTADLMLEAQRRAWAAGLTGLHDFDPP